MPYFDDPGRDYADRDYEEKERFDNYDDEFDDDDRYETFTDDEWTYH